jgi:peptidoglycan/LPS O-acetylase OafA/YrhL
VTITTSRPNNTVTAGAGPGNSGSASSGRSLLNALTGLRLFAALAVYFSHLPAPQGAPRWLLTLQQSGYVGVTFFFVLSGFVLTLNYFDGLRTPQQLWSYAVARIARVYPLYLLVLAWPTIGLWATGNLPTKDLLLHVLGLQAWNPDLGIAYAFVAPAWSISVELFLYATLPFLVVLVRLVDRRMWTLLGSVALVLAGLLAVAWLFTRTGRADLAWTDPASAHRWLYRTPLMRVGDFLLGILAARVYVALRNRSFGERLGSWLILPATGVSVFLAAQSSLVFSAWSWDAMYALPAVTLILGLALAPRSPMSRFLALRTVVFLGEASFAFYLIHYTVIGLLGAGAWSNGVTLQLVVLEAMHLGLATALAVGLHVGIEKPARVVVKRLLDRSRPRPAERAGTGRVAARDPLHHGRAPVPRHPNRPVRDGRSAAAGAHRSRPPELVDAAPSHPGSARARWTPPTTRPPVDDSRAPAHNAVAPL